MYRGRLQQDLGLWVEKGLIEPAQAAAMLADYDSRPASFSLGRVLAVLAAVLVAAAILLLVASNWDAIPRLVRVVGCLALIWFFYLSGAALAVRGQSSLATAMLLLATLSFGAAMSLVAQMYHISGDEMTLVLTWFGLACLSAIAFRSASQVVVAGFLAWAQFALYLENHVNDWTGWAPFGPPLMAAVLLALIHYTGANRARHLVYLLLIGWLTWLYSLHQGLGLAALYTALGLAAFAAVALPWSPLSRLLRNTGPAPAFYCFAVVAIGLLLLHFEVSGGPRLAGLGLSTLAIAVAAIAICGRDNGAVRYLAYLVFAAEMLFLAEETIGSIIGTSGFFLISGLLVAIVAWIVIRLERRFAAAEGQEAAP